MSYLDILKKSTAFKGIFVQPSPIIKGQVSNLVEKIFNKQDPSIEMTKLKMSKETVNGIDFYIPAMSKLMTCTIVHKPTSNSNLLLESLHNGKDGVMYIANDILESDLDFRFMILNYLHPNAVRPVGTQHAISDMCHNVNNLATTIQCKIYDLCPNTLTLQIHGMSSGQVKTTKQIMLVNIFNSQFTKNKSGCTMFARALMSSFNQDQCRMFQICSINLPFENVFMKPNGGVNNTNVQGRQLNKKNDSGRFIHLELSPTFRANGPNSKNMRKKLILAFKDMLIQWDNYSGLKVAEREENPIPCDNDCDSVTSNDID
jgi:23S rRNA U2552 (ribose-2'-O)-methylase RlmE/FtsJ